MRPDDFDMSKPSTNLIFRYIFTSPYFCVFSVFCWNNAKTIGFIDTRQIFVVKLGVWRNFPNHRKTASFIDKTTFKSYLVTGSDLQKLSRDGHRHVETSSSHVSTCRYLFLLSSHRCRAPEGTCPTGSGCSRLVNIVTRGHLRDHLQPRRRYSLSPPLLDFTGAPLDQRILLSHNAP